MATELQKNLAKNIVKNLKRRKPLNKKELVVSSGYDMTTAEKQIPAVFEQKGVREELKILGFSEEKAKEVVAGIMLNEEVEPNARLKATDQVFKVSGSYKDNLDNGKTLVLVISGESAKRYDIPATRNSS